MTAPVEAGQARRHPKGRTVFVRGLGSGVYAGLVRIWYPGTDVSRWRSVKDVEKWPLVGAGTQAVSP